MPIDITRTTVAVEGGCEACGRDRDRVPGADECSVLLIEVHRPPVEPIPASIAVNVLRLCPGCARVLVASLGGEVGR